jgi:hypothetical protein
MRPIRVFERRRRRPPKPIPDGESSGNGCRAGLNKAAMGQRVESLPNDGTRVPSHNSRRREKTRALRGRGEPGPSGAMERRRQRRPLRRWYGVRYCLTQRCAQFVGKGAGIEARIGGKASRLREELREDGTSPCAYKKRPTTPARLTLRLALRMKPVVD